MRRIPIDPTTPGPWAGIQEFHGRRSLALTARQLELFGAVFAGPDPGLVLAGYGGAMGGGKTRAIVELAIDAALAFRATTCWWRGSTTPTCRARR